MQPCTSMSTTITQSSRTVDDLVVRVHRTRPPVDSKAPPVVVLHGWGASIDAVGSLTNPSWASLDLRVQYVRPIRKARFEAFVDIFNVTDTQDATRLQDLLAGSGQVSYLDAIRFLDPRRFFIGFRVSF